MTRQLVIIRHAHSPRPKTGQSDRDRPISEHGREQAADLARQLVEIDRIPRRVISSDARRTRETWQAMKETLVAEGERNFEVEFTEDFYGAGVDAICEHLWALSDDVRRVALIGHNPGWSRAVGWLSDTRASLSPANAALLEGPETAWTDAAQKNQWRLADFLRPAAT